MKHNSSSTEAPLILIGGYFEKKILRIQELIKEYKKENKIVGVLSSIETQEFYKEADVVLSLGSKNDLQAVAKNVFIVINELNKKRVDIILVETFPAKEPD